MSNIERISADYRANGMERAVIGFDYDTGQWAVEEGTCTKPFHAKGFTVTKTTHFPLAEKPANDYRPSGESEDAAAAYMRDQGYH